MALTANRSTFPWSEHKSFDEQTLVKEEEDKVDSSGEART